MVTADVLASWSSLQRYHNSVGKSLVLKEEFQKNNSRFKDFSFTFSNPLDKTDILFDFSKNLITKDIFEALVQLAKDADVEGLRNAMFRGDKINLTEDRSVLHIALRNLSDKPILVDGEDVMPAVQKELEHMDEFSQAIRSGTWKGFTGKPLTTIINIGIGGSDL